MANKNVHKIDIRVDNNFALKSIQKSGPTAVQEYQVPTLLKYFYHSWSEEIIQYTGFWWIFTV